MLLMSRSKNFNQKVFLLPLLLVLFIAGMAQPQKDAYADSLKKQLSQAHNDVEKNNWLLELAEYYSNIDNKLSDNYARQAMQTAELSRNRKLVVNTFLKNGIRYIAMAGLANNIQLAKENFEQAEKVARDNGFDDELAFSYTGLSRVYRGAGDNDKALNYNNLAISIASTGNNDSLKMVAFNSLGNTYRSKNEQLLAFRNYLQALNVAELSKKSALIKNCYSRLSDFYAGIEDFDKAIDYDMKVLDIDRQNNNRYAILDDYNNIGKLFTAKKQYDIALKMYEDAITLADSLHFDVYKLNSYLNIANMYFSNGDNARGLAYLNSHQVVLDYFKTAGMGFFLDEGYGGIYTELGKLDSAYYFLKKAEPEIEQRANMFVKYGFYLQFGQYYKRRTDYKNAIAYFLKANNIGIASKDISLLENTSKNLDTLYTLGGDYKTAYFYSNEYNKYKDSIKTLAKATDLLKLEVDADNRRRDRLAKEEEANTIHRHNVQYMGITAGIAALFIIMVMLGFFIVSPRTIRVLGFFSFIFLFEFIILLADKQIHEWTHGEPWKVMLIKIFLVAILLPLHHWLEHKVIHYLNSRKKLVPNDISFFNKLFRKKAASAQVQEP